MPQPTIYQKIKEATDAITRRADIKPTSRHRAGLGPGIASPMSSRIRSSFLTPTSRTSTAPRSKGMRAA